MELTGVFAERGLTLAHIAMSLLQAPIPEETVPVLAKAAPACNGAVLASTGKSSEAGRGWLWRDGKAGQLKARDDWIIASHHNGLAEARRRHLLGGGAIDELPGRGDDTDGRWSLLIHVQPGREIVGFNSIGDAWTCPVP